MITQIVDNGIVWYVASLDSKAERACYYQDYGIALEYGAKVINQNFCSVSVSADIRVHMTMADFDKMYAVFFF